MSAKNFAVVSVNRHQFRGLRPSDPGTRSLVGDLASGPTGGTAPDPTAAPTSLREIFLALSVKYVVHPWTRMTYRTCRDCEAGRVQTYVKLLRLICDVLICATTDLQHQLPTSESLSWEVFQHFDSVVQHHLQAT